MKKTNKNTEIKEVTVFSDGDASLLSTWSNVPYFFTQTLIDKGIKVNRIDISSSSKYLKSFFNRFIFPIIFRINRDTNYNYFRSLIHFLEVKWKIYKAIKKYKDSDLFISLTFSFSAVGLTNKPVVLFGDWTYEHFFEYFRNREPDRFERTSIGRENKQINRASFALPLFPKIGDKMKFRYPQANIHYLGNVINACIEPSKEIIEKKVKSKCILFIGTLKYREGAKQLIEACNLLEKGDDVEVHIIGMKESNFDVNLGDNIKCYGYLNKSIPNEKEIYYELLGNAKLIVNTTPQWGAFSSMIEAMYFYTPVITTPYPEFVETFGENITFGYYFDNEPIDVLANSIEKIFDNSNYKELSSESHRVVKDFTWNNYIDKMLKVIDNHKI